MTPLPSVDHLALVKERGWNRFLPAFNYLGNHYVLLSFLFSALITFLIYFDYRFPIPLYNPGEIAKEDIRAPIEFLVQDLAATENQRLTVLRQVPPVYNWVPEAEAATEARVRRFFRYLLKPGDRLRATEEFGVDLSPFKDGLGFGSRNLTRYEKEILTSLDLLYRNELLLDKEDLEREGKKEVLLIKEGQRLPLSLTLAWGKNEIAQFMEQRLPQESFSPLERSFLVSTFYSLFVPPYLENRVESENLRKAAESTISPVMVTVKKGRVIVRNGDEVSPKAQEALLQLKARIEKGREHPLLLYLGTFLLITILSIIVAEFLKVLPPSSTKLRRLHQLIVFNLLVTLVLFRLFHGSAALAAGRGLFPDLLSGDHLFFLVPFQFGGLLISFLLSFPLAVVYISLMTTVTGLFLLNDTTLVITLFLTSLLPAALVPRFGQHRRSTLPKVSLFILLPTSVVLILLRQILLGPINAGSWKTQLIAAFLGSFINIIVASSLVPVEESLFRVVSKLRLLELSNLDLPIFREMALKAPGTYHHSLMMASLAEQAALNIGLDPALVRCQALYHDIGKIARPHYFIENQNYDEGNPHDKIDPQTSILYIKNHIYDGLALGKKQRLPQQILDAIQQHHGTSLIKFFYNKALEQARQQWVKKNGDETPANLEELGVNDELFRYGGPKPQTKETAILMLADGAEAAAKSLKSFEEKYFRVLLKKIFENSIEDGQLSECPLSLKDLSVLESSFLQALKTIYHERISYPGFDFSEEVGKGHTHENASAR